MTERDRDGAQTRKSNPDIFIIAGYDLASHTQSYVFRVQMDFPIKSRDGWAHVDVALKKGEFSHANDVLKNECGIADGSNPAHVVAAALNAKPQTRKRPRDTPQGLYPDPDSITLNDYNAANSARVGTLEAYQMTFRVQMDLVIPNALIATELSSELLIGDAMAVWQTLKSKCGVADDGSPGDDLILLALGLFPIPPIPG